MVSGRRGGLGTKSDMGGGVGRSLRFLTGDDWPSAEYPGDGVMSTCSLSSSSSSASTNVSPRAREEERCEECKIFTGKQYY